MNKLMESGHYSKNAGKARIDIEEVITELFKKLDGKLSKESIYTLIVGASVNHLINEQLFEEDPLSDDNDLAVDMITKIINAVEDIINRSPLPTEVVTAYGTKAIYGLANMRDL